MDRLSPTLRLGGRERRREGGRKGGRDDFLVPGELRFHLEGTKVQNPRFEGSQGDGIE